MRQYQGSISNNPDLFFRFNLEYWRNLFPTNDYAKISVQPSVEETLSIVKPDETDNASLEEGRLPASFVAKRFAQRGGGFNQWQSQVRGSSVLPQVMTICNPLQDGREFPALPQDSFYYVTVYVKVKKTFG